MKDVHIHMKTLQYFFQFLFVLFIKREKLPISLFYRTKNCKRAQNLYIKGNVHKHFKNFWKNGNMTKIKYIAMSITIGKV